MLTQEYLRECLDYNENTGEFFWRERPKTHFKSKKSMKVFNSKFSGKLAGSVEEYIGKDGQRKSRIRIRLQDKAYLAHRLAWLHVLGFVPEHVAHSDGNGLNNSIKNVCEFI